MAFKIWNPNASELRIDQTDLDHFSARVFSIFIFVRWFSCLGFAMSRHCVSFKKLTSYNTVCVLPIIFGQTPYNTKRYANAYQSDAAKGRSLQFQAAPTSLLTPSRSSEDAAKMHLFHCKFGFSMSMCVASIGFMFGW